MKSENIDIISLYKPFIEMQGLKEALLKESGGSREAFISIASESILLHVLRRTPADSESGKFLAKCYKKGISSEALAYALATSWFDEKSTFCLEYSSDRSKMLSHRGIVFLISTFFSLIVTFTGLWVFKTFFPSLVSTLLILEPILAAIGFVLAILFYELWVVLEKVKNK